MLAAAADEDMSTPPQRPKKDAPLGWDKANRVSADALAMMSTGETAMAELILTKGGCGAGLG